jgi:hypothetical protein
MSACMRVPIADAGYVDCMATPSGPHLCYALAARKSDRHLSRLYDGHLASAGLSVSQFSILGLLKEHGRLKITELRTC